jgi:hypothetical protein
MLPVVPPVQVKCAPKEVVPPVEFAAPPLPIVAIMVLIAATSINLFA